MLITNHRTRKKQSPPPYSTKVAQAQDLSKSTKSVYVLQLKICFSKSSKISIYRRDNSIHKSSGALGSTLSL